MVHPISSSYSETFFLKYDLTIFRKRVEHPKLFQRGWERQTSAVGEFAEKKSLSKLLEKLDNTNHHIFFADNLHKICLPLRFWMGMLGRRRSLPHQWSSREQRCLRQASKAQSMFRRATTTSQRVPRREMSPTAMRSHCSRVPLMLWSRPMASCSVLWGAAARVRMGVRVRVSERDRDKQRDWYRETFWRASSSVVTSYKLEGMRWSKPLYSANCMKNCLLWYFFCQFTPEQKFERQIKRKEKHREMEKQRNREI